MLNIFTHNVSKIDRYVMVSIYSFTFTHNWPICYFINQVDGIYSHSKMLMVTFYNLKNALHNASLKPLL